jgi:methionyl-tRNA formyltransferase
MRMLFLGSPSFAVTPLEALAGAGYEIVAVITQPDRPAGRRRQLSPPPVKLAAERLGLPVLQPETLRDPASVAALAALQPDIAVVAAYGEILRRRILEIPPLGYVNIHPSLLPRHRGPTPVAGAILAGDSETGVSIMRLDRGMDSGPLLAQVTVPLTTAARTGSLTAELFHLGSDLLLEVLPPYIAGQLQPQEQNHSQATVTRLLNRADSHIDWNLPAIVIERRIRAFDPWPGTTGTWRSQPLKILAARVQNDWPGAEPPGSLLIADGHPLVRTGSGVLELLTVQPAGKRPMSAVDWLQGQRAATGEQFGT